MRIILPGQQRVNATEEILSGWSHWEMRLYCLSLTRVAKRTESDCALCDPRKLILHGYKRFWWSQKRYEQTREAIIIARTELMFSGEFRLPLSPDRTHTGPGTRFANGLQFGVQQVNGEVLVHVWRILCLLAVLTWLACCF